MESIGTVLIILLGLTFIIFIHELGHFLVARWNGVKVEVFSIGIGPRFITVFKDRLGTEYVLSLLPLGGYVRLKGQEELPKVETKAETRASADRATTSARRAYSKDHYLAKTPLQRLSIILAGVTMNVISAYFMIVLAFSLGVPFTTNQVGEVLPNTPAQAAGLKKGDTILAIDSTPINSFEEMLVKVAFAGAEPLELLVERENERLTLKATPQVNPSNPLVKQLGIAPFPVAAAKKLSTIADREADKILAAYYLTLEQAGLKENYVIKKVSLLSQGEETQYATTAPGLSRLMTKNPGAEFSITFFEGNASSKKEKTIGPFVVPQQKHKKAGFEFLAKIIPLPEYPAQQAGLQQGDEVVAINGEAVRGWSSLVQLLQEKSKANREQGNRSLGAISEPVLTVSVRRARAQAPLTFEVQPRFDPSTGQYIMGVTPLTTSSNRGREISYISPAMAAKVPGLRVGDRVLALQQKPSQPLSFDFLSRRTRPRAQSNIYQAAVIREGNEISFVYDDGGLAEETIGVPLPVSSGQKFIRYSPWQAFSKAVPQAFLELKEIGLFLANLIKGNISPKAVGGPIAIFEVSYTVAEVKGWAYFILLFAKISLSLAVMNLLPIPVLDGGHAAFLMYEMVRRRPPPQRVVMVMNFVGLMLLLFLFLFVNYNDVLRLIEN